MTSATTKTPSPLSSPTPALTSKSGDRWVWIAVGGFAAIALALSCIGIDSRSMWLDEATTWNVTSQSGSNLLNAISGQGANMAFYYLFVHFFGDVFGRSLLALRLPSVIAGASIAPLTFLIGRRTGGTRVGLLACGLSSVSLPLVLWAQNARGYEFGAAFATASVLFFLRSLDTDRKRDWALWVLFSSLAVYSLVLCMLVVVVELVALLVRWRAAIPWRHVLVSTAVLVASGTWMAWVVLGLQHTPDIRWVATNGHSSGHSSNQVAGIVGSLASAQAQGFYLGAAGKILLVLTALLWAVAVLAVARILFKRRSVAEHFPFLVVVLWLVIPVIAGIIGPPLMHQVLHQISKNAFITDRYYLAEVPAGTILAAHGLARMPSRAVTGGLLAVLVGLRLSVLAPTYGVSLDQYEQASAEILANARAGDCITFRIASSQAAFVYYATHPPAGSPDRVPRLVLPTQPEPRTPLDLREELFTAGQSFWAVPPKTVITEETSSCRSVWLMISHISTLGAPVATTHSPRSANIRVLTSTLQGAFPRASVTKFTNITLEHYQR